MSAAAGTAPGALEPKTLEQVINDRPLSALQIRAIVLCALVVLIDGYDLQAMALTVSSLSEAWKLPPPVFSQALAASMYGLLAGSIVVAPLGDIVGRRPVIIGGLLVMGVASLSLIFSTEPLHLVFGRFVVGIGLGACQGNATALTAEYSPLLRRAVIMTIMGCNIALGALIGGLIAPLLIAHWGWQGVFIVGGVAPLALALLMWIGAPESLQLLFSKRPQDSRVAAILKRMAPDVDPRSLAAAAPKSQPRSSVLDLLRKPLLERTLRLWLIYSFNSFLLYLLVSWLPVILSGAGWSKESSLHGVAMLQLGGIGGALLLSWFVDRKLTIPALISSYLVSAVVAVLFTQVPSDGPVWPFLIVALGAGISGAMFTLMAIGAIFYPPAVRATGFSWTAAVARSGAIMGPIAGGWLLGAGIPSQQIIALLAVPAVMSAFIAFSLRNTLRQAQREQN